MTHKDDDLLTVPEIITELRIHRSTWQKMVSAGTTPPIVKIAGAQRVRYGAYREWLMQNESTGQAA
jgi:predicted DNA-binding transcriptional regulator AlpA